MIRNLHPRKLAAWALVATIFAAVSWRIKWALDHGQIAHDPTPKT